MKDKKKWKEKHEQNCKARLEKIFAFLAPACSHRKNFYPLIFFPCHSLHRTDDNLYCMGKNLFH